MPLTKADIKKIENVIKAETGLITARLDNFESYVRRRFDEVDIRFDKIERKIDQLIKTEDEDMQVAFKEIHVLKLRLKKLESKVYST